MAQGRAAGDGETSEARRDLGAMLRARSDQLLVLVALIAIWQVLSLTLGSYWVGSPWGVLTRFAAGIASGELLRHASYTLSEAVAGFLLGALPAAALPFGPAGAAVRRARATAGWIVVPSRKRSRTPGCT